jgi:hypothetical protein
MLISELDEMLSRILGNMYGGPSISYEDGKFVLYEWFDAPVEMQILAEAYTFEELMAHIKKEFDKKD